MKGRVGILTALVVICLLPWMAAWWFTSHPKELSKRLTYHGALVVPHTAWKSTGKWVLVTSEESDCSSTCIQKLHQLKVIKKLMGKESNRVQVWLVLNHAPSKPLTLRVDELMVVKAESMLQPNRVYIVDPLGNLVLYYLVVGEGLLKDLKHLLQVSQIG